MRRVRWQVWAVSGLLALLSCQAGPAKAVQGSRPNLLFIVADDMAHDDLEIAGHPILRTPHLDRLARTGVRFTHAFTPNPICTPSRAAILTGQDCYTNGCYFFGMPIKKESTQFAEVLSKAGYDTYYTGKWHNDGAPGVRGYASGGHVIMGGCPARRGGHAKPFVRDLDGKNRRQVGKFCTTVTSDHAIEYLNGRKKDARPFLMFVSYSTPHDPWAPPKKYLEMYPPEKIPLPPNFMARPSFAWFTDWHGTVLRDEGLWPFPRTPEGCRDVRSRYYGMVTQMDHEIGRLLDALDAKGLSDDTLVLFVADHGISLGAHGFSGKQTMYEEGIRLPLIMRDPRLKRGGPVSSELVSLMDIYPTLCEAAGVPIPSHVEGRSLLAPYQGRGPGRKRIFAAFHSPTRHRMNSRAVRTRRFKYIQNLTTGEIELYDLEHDPYELANLAFLPEFEETRRGLEADLLAWRREREPR